MYVNSENHFQCIVHRSDRGHNVMKKNIILLVCLVIIIATSVSFTADKSFGPKEYSLSKSKETFTDKVKLKSNRLRRMEKELTVDDSSDVITLNPNKCVLCGRCVWTCRNRLGIGVLGFSRRGFDRRIGTFENRPLAESNCEGCGDCADVCPSGALTYKVKV